MFDFLNVFLAQGCFFVSDKIISKSHSGDQPATAELAGNMRKYAEFFTDFCIQESDLIKVDAHQLACAVLAFTRKHLNCHIIWPQQMELLTMNILSSFR